MSQDWDEEFDPSGTCRSVLRWAESMGALTLGEAYDMLEQLAISNDIPEVLGHDGDLDDVRAEFEDGLDIVGPETLIESLQ